MSDAGSPPQERRDDASVDSHDGAGDAGNESDDILSEIDEGEFEHYEPDMEKRQTSNIIIDENITKGLKASRRKITDSVTNKKPKEGRRPKKRTRGEDDDDLDANDIIEDGDRRPRKARAGESGRRSGKKEAPRQEEIPEENLTPEERRRRALERAMDAALKPTTKRRRKKDDIVCLPLVDLVTLALSLYLTRMSRISRTKSMNKLPISKSPWKTPVWLTTKPVRMALRPPTSFNFSLKSQRFSTGQPFKIPFSTLKPISSKLSNTSWSP